MYVYVHTYIHTYVCVRVRVSVCTYVCVCDNVYKMYVFVGVGCFGLPQVFAKKNVVKRKAVMTKKKKTTHSLAHNNDGFVFSGHLCPCQHVCQLEHRAGGIRTAILGPSHVMELGHLLVVHSNINLRVHWRNCINIINCGTLSHYYT